MTYNKILVPYDSSKPSETALEHAIQIAKMSGISLLLILLSMLYFYTSLKIYLYQLLLVLAYLNQRKQEI